MPRFLITMRQAVHLIESALGTMDGGEVFISHVPACTMEDLAEAAYWSGGRIYTGLRPGGEKRQTRKLLMRYGDSLSGVIGNDLARHGREQFRVGRLQPGSATRLMSRSLPP